MLVIRPARLSDVDRLLELAELTSFGLTTLSRDRSLLEKRVIASLRAFQQLDDDQPSGQKYLLVMEQSEQQLVVGTSGLVAKVGGFEPFYAYRVETAVHESRMLGIRREIEVLHLVKEHNGPSEIGSLFLHPEYRGAGNGRFLSLSRFLFIAEHRQLFDQEVIAEMRGVIDATGHTPFWDALGRHFFDLEYAKADALSVVNKEFIGSLMPEHPIYICLLPEEAQAVIGAVHELTQPAKQLLESEGFRYQKLVDIFEAGPLVHCPRDEIRTVRESRIGTLSAIGPLKADGPQWMIASGAEGFRATRGRLGGHGEELVIEAEVAAALQVDCGAKLRIATVKPQKQENL